MSTKPFLIVQVTEGELGVIHERCTFSEAVDLGVKLAMEQCDSPEADIRAEFERDTDFMTPDKDIRIHLAQTED